MSEFAVTFYVAEQPETVTEIVEVDDRYKDDYQLFRAVEKAAEQSGFTHEETTAINRTDTLEGN